MRINIYSPTETDFSGNGLGTLTPISCVVAEEAGGMFDLEIMHPIDDTLRWAQLQKNYIIKAPVPTRPSPIYEETVGSAQTRQIYEVYNTSVGVYMRSGPGKSYKNYGYLKNGAEVVLLEQTNSSWYHVCVVDGGRVCYMSSKYLRYARSETEHTGGSGQAGSRVIRYTQSQDQLFRIYSVERDTKKRTVSARAMHIFYDLRANIIIEKCEFEKTAFNAALEEIYEKLMDEPEHRLHIAAGMTEKISGDYSYKNPVEAMMDPEEGMLAQGKALLVRDNFDIFALPRHTWDSGVTIRRGKNLKGVVVTEDGADIVTRIIPCGKDKDGNELFLSGTTYVDSPNIGLYPFPMIRKIDYDVKTVGKDADGETSFSSDAASRTRLQQLAEEDFSKNGIDLPHYSMKVDFLLLQNTAEYQNYAALQAVFLHDSVRVIDGLVGLDAKVRVCGYEWDCLTLRYKSIQLGDIEKLEQAVYGYSIPAGSVSGTKIAPGSASGNILRDLTVEYAKISAAAIERLSADSITAVTAYIQEIAAGSITTDELYAAIAEIIALKVETLDAGSITADRLAAALAAFTVLTAGTASFDKATIAHLVAEAMNLEFGVAGEVFIRNLAVEYAQILGATIGNLCIRASDGGYYRIDVGTDGLVTATPVTLTDGEISAGQTGDGRVILETSITAETLSTSTLLATYALVNEIDAARIDVDQLFAREAFITLLTTSRIIGGKSLAMIAGEAENASRVFRQEEPPGAEDGVRENDLWIVPSTGSTWQAVRIDVQIRWAMDENGMLGYEITGDYGGRGMYMDEDGVLHCDALTIGLDEEGRPTIEPLQWVNVSDVFTGDTPPANPEYGKFWMNTGTTPPMLMRYVYDAATDAGEWEPVTDLRILEEKAEELDKRQELLEDQLRDLATVLEIDNDGVHIYKDKQTNEVMITDRDVQIKVSGEAYSKFLARALQLGQYRVWEPESGGMAFGPM